MEMKQILKMRGRMKHFETPQLSCGVARTETSVPQNCKASLLQFEVREKKCRKKNRKRFSVCS